MSAYRCCVSTFRLTSPGSLPKQTVTNETLLSTGSSKQAGNRQRERTCREPEVEAARLTVPFVPCIIPRGRTTWYRTHAAEQLTPLLDTTWLRVAFMTLCPERWVWMCVIHVTDLKPSIECVCSRLKDVSSVADRTETWRLKILNQSVSISLTNFLNLIAAPLLFRNASLDMLMLSLAAVPRWAIHTYSRCPYMFIDMRGVMMVSWCKMWFIKHLHIQLTRVSEERKVSLAKDSTLRIISSLSIITLNVIRAANIGQLND